MTGRVSLWLGSLGCSLLVMAALGADARAQARHRAKAAHKTAPAAEPAAGAGAEPAATPAGVPAQDAAAQPAEPPPAVEASAPAPPPAPVQAPASSAPAPQPAAPAGDDTEVASMRQDLAHVMDDLVQARARVAVLGKALFKTRVRVKIDDRAAPEQVAARIELWLDGAPIWSGDGTTLRDPDRALFDGFAAPGPHLLTLEVEQRARGDDTYRYTLHESYRFVVVREKRTDLRLVLDDDSDMADDFPSDHEGEYDVRSRLQVRAVDLNEE